MRMVNKFGEGRVFVAGGVIYSVVPFFMSSDASIKMLHMYTPPQEVKD